jgi:hypothetical protein
VTDARTSEPVSDAEVLVGTVQLLPTPLPEEYGTNPAGLYVTDDLEGGSYPFRVRRAGYRTLAAKLAVPPVPERIAGHDPPVVLETEDERESGGTEPSFRVMVLWQKYLRGSGPGAEPPHPPTTKPPGVSPHTIITHPPPPPQ